MSDAISDGMRLSQPLSRKQEKVCAKCNRHWWSWGRTHDVCWVCDPPPPPVGKAFVAKVQAGDPTVRL